MRDLPAESALVDGEAVAFRSDGQSDFGALRTKVGGARTCLVAFDLLTLDGEDLRQRPLEERRDRLARLIAAGADGVVFSEAWRPRARSSSPRPAPLESRGDRVEARSGAYIGEETAGSWLKAENPAFMRS